MTKLIIYTVKAEKHHNNWKLGAETITDETETLNILIIFNNKEFITLFDELISAALDIKQMHKDIIY